VQTKNDESENQKEEKVVDQLADVKEKEDDLDDDDDDN